MGRTSATGLGFAITGGVPTDLGQVIHLEPGRDHQPGKRRLMAVVEPLDPTGRGIEVAEAALAALREGFWGAAGQPLSLALGEAFAAANAAVRDENRLAPGEGRDRRVGVGATAIAVEGRQLVLAQVPPSQAILVQEGRVYAFPDLASWDGRFTALHHRIEPEPEPLGRQECASPDLYRTLAAPEDLVVLCASALPMSLVRVDEEPDRLSPHASFEALLQSGDPEAVAARLGRIADAHDLGHAHAACCTIGRLHCLDVSLAREHLARLALACGFTTPGAAAAQTPRVAGVHGRRRGRAPGPSVPGAAPSAGRRRRSYARLGIPLGGDDEPDPGIASVQAEPPDPIVTSVDEAHTVQPTLTDTEPIEVAADLDSASPATASTAPPNTPEPRPRPQPVGGDTGTVRGHRPLAIEDGPIGVLTAPAAVTGHPGGGVPNRDPSHALPCRRAGRTIAVSAPGVLGLQRHRARPTVSLPGGWRVNLPQRRRRRRTGPVRRLGTTLLAVVLMTGLIGAFGVGPMAGAAERTGVRSLTAQLPLPAWTRLTEAERSSAAIALAEADHELRQATATTDPNAADRAIALADEALDRAVAAGADPAAVAARQTELAAARERADGVIRLGAARQLAVLPTAIEGGARLLIDGEDVLVAIDGLYRYATDERALVEIVEPEQTIDELTVDELRGAALNGDGVLLSDGRALYLGDDAGDWTARSLPPPPADAAAWPAAPCGAFEGNFYLLDTGTGRILKFAADAPGAAPRDWANSASAEDLRLGRDMVVDGRIHVLLADGRVLTFYLGQIEQTYEIPAELPIDDPVALAADAEGHYLYVLDRGDGEGDGRLYRIERDGGTVRELALDAEDAADGTNLLASGRAIAVDEVNGAFYLLTDEALWRGALP